MRLLNTHTLELEEYFTETIQARGIKYDILSHTWVLGEELSFAYWMHLTDYPQSEKSSRLKQRSGYHKIRQFVTTVRNNKGCDYVWVDTIAINKDSSAELSEAINSMFRWYSLATFCYAYLVDVYDTSHFGEELSQFRDSRWFTRGWTLQELIAPSQLQFYNASWCPIAYRSELGSLLADITGLPVEIMDGSISYSYNRYSIAQIMSWASMRVTTREEDEAYSLLGLFDVNMPLIYGEGPKAFSRLQEQLLRTRKDHSILAWHRPPLVYSFRPMARSAENFASSADVETIIPLEVTQIGSMIRGLQMDRPHELTNYGLRIFLPLFSCREIEISTTSHRCVRGNKCVFALIKAFVNSDGDSRFIAIQLSQNNNVGSSNHFFHEVSAVDCRHTVSWQKLWDALKVKPRVAEEILLLYDE